jgi:hypothetical protein
MIIGLNFTKILIEKTSNKNNQKITKIGTKTDILSIEEEKVEIPDKKAFRANFSFSVSYEPDLAKILIDGSLLYLNNPENISEAISSWKKKNLTPEIRLELLNYIMARCNVKALLLEEDLNLPSHFPLPRFQSKQPEKSEEKGSKNNKTDYAG